MLNRVVIPGIEVFLSDVPASLRGKRVGFITNESAVDRSKTPDIDLIAKHKDLQLTALFAPEHGIRGTVEAGVQHGILLVAKMSEIERPGASVAQSDTWRHSGRLTLAAADNRSISRGA